MAEEDADADAAVLSDVDGDDDPVPIVLLPSPSATATSEDAASPDAHLRDLLADLERERQARKVAEEARTDLQNSFTRLKILAHEAIRKRDEAHRERDAAAGELSDSLRQKGEALKQRDEALILKDEALKQKDEALKQREEALKQREEALNQKDASRSEIEAAAQMLVTGIDKISGKVGSFKNFSGGGLPRSQKYATGLPAVAYGVIKRANEIVEELVRQIDAAAKGRDEARGQVEQRNYEIAIEVSQLEATIAGLREEVSSKGSRVENLEKLVNEKDARISEMDGEILELRRFGEECEGKWKGLQAKLDAQRPVVMDQLNYISRVHEQICEIINYATTSGSGQSEFSESQFIWKEMDMDENLRTSLDGTVSVCELVKVAAEKVKEGMEEWRHKVEGLSETVAHLVAEKQHIGILLRSALSAKTSEVRQVAENGLREAGIDFKFDANGKREAVDREEDEVYTLAGALENTVKASQLEIIELQHLVQALRAESSLLKAHLDAQAKEISQLKHYIKELEEKERVANESVEGLMMDIAAAEEEITRWKVAAEQEAAAGRAIEQDFAVQLSAVQQELEEAKQAVLESENKLKFKEETAAAAMGARDAAEKSLRLADMRSARLRERVEELNRQLEESDNREDPSSRSGHRYVCWPWQWLGLNIVSSQTETLESSNEMELSEPLI